MLSCRKIIEKSVKVSLSWGNFWWLHAFIQERNILFICDFTHIIRVSFLFLKKYRTVPCGGAVCTQIHWSDLELFWFLKAKSATTFSDFEQKQVCQEDPFNLLRFFSVDICNPVLLGKWKISNSPQIRSVQLNYFWQNQSEKLAWKIILRFKSVSH